MLKFLSSHRGLTYVSPTPVARRLGCASLTTIAAHRHELFDEYTRRQFAAKAPGIENPFGTEEALLKFADFDVFKKVGPPSSIPPLLATLAKPCHLTYPPLYRFVSFTR